MYAVFNGAVQKLAMPHPHECVLPGIQWGAFDELLTPAYWRGQAWQHQNLGTYSDLRLGRTLVEEVAACLLGGYGMPSDLALAAYRRVREAGILRGTPEAAEIEIILSEPFVVQGRIRHYRFVNQKARYLSACIRHLSTFRMADDDLVFRDHLAELPGIGLKTASWVVRNMRSSGRIAIIDIHILRAGRHIGLFPEAWVPQKNYRDLEHKFVSFASAIEVPAAALDGLIWDYMRRLSPSIFKPPSTQLNMFATYAM
jgi:thermostable 8-oxoguanine DNA glycosylase